MTSYLYRADGVKVKKLFGDLETHHLDGFQYKSTKPSESSVVGTDISVIDDPSEVTEIKLRIIPTSEGYYDALLNQYIYNYTDHLGNVRLSYTDTNKDGVIQPRQYFQSQCEDIPWDPFNPPSCISIWKPGEIVEINTYYPFGLLHNYGTTTQNAYQYKYYGKELQESGMYDYVARLYMPDIGGLGVVDRLAEKMTRHSPYNYAFNNPLRFIDPDGRAPKHIGFTSTVREDGTTVVTMTVTGKLINESGKTFTSEQMNDYANRLSGSIKNSYGVKGDKFEVNVVTNITVATEDNKLGATDHAFRIVDDGKLPDSNNPGGFRPEGIIGHAAFGELGVYINAEIVNDNKPATTGTYAGTGKTDTGGATLERTGSHELGHTGTLPHSTPGIEDGNLMHQTSQLNAGTQITKEQILKMQKAYDNGELNKGRQSY